MLLSTKPRLCRRFSIARLAWRGWKSSIAKPVPGSDPSKISPDNWVIDQAYQDRPGNKDIQLSILYNAKRDLDVYADWQEYFRKQQPPTLITWGKNDGIFTVEGAELFKRDIPSAELHLLDTGHFALEEEVDRIGSLMHKFLDRTINKK